jgi:hypothetical protein
VLLRILLAAAEIQGRASTVDGTVDGAVGSPCHEGAPSAVCLALCFEAMNGWGKKGFIAVTGVILATRRDIAMRNTIFLDVGDRTGWMSRR